MKEILLADVKEKYYSMISIYKNTGLGNDIVKSVNWCGPYGTGIISFFGCNLQCPFCFAQKYSYSNPNWGVFLDTKRRIIVNKSLFKECILDFIRKNPTTCYLQLTGGKPIKYLGDLDEIIEVLVDLDEYGLRIIFQTNGLTLGRDPEQSSKFLLRLEKLSESFVLFELSFKGTNPQEFQILSGLDWDDGYRMQTNSYWVLREVCNSRHNLNVVARLGIGNHRKSISFVYPESRSPMFLKDNWSQEFLNIYEDLANRSGYARMVCETINAEGDGSVNNYLHCSIPALSRCAKAKCISSRIVDSKAVKRVKETPKFGDKIPTDTDLEEYYLEFLKFFEPMKSPAHIYCGRDEFTREFRRNCNPKCQWK